ncbi:MAG TPA: hypothetical protein VK824_03755 [Planctomycetota bacterium]|nr:hypothetical protein [Planctomycetota bacterium]
MPRAGRIVRALAATLFFGWLLAGCLTTHGAVGSEGTPSSEAATSSEAVTPSEVALPSDIALPSEVAALSGTLPVYASLDGGGGAITTREFHVLRDEAEWKALWKRHRGEREKVLQPRFTTDFTRCMILAAFEGRTQQSWGYRLDSAERVGSAVVLRITPVHFQTSGEAPSLDVNPFGIFVLPRHEGEVIVLENVAERGLPRWEERLRVPPLAPSPMPAAAGTGR